MMQHIDAALAAALSEIERQASPQLPGARKHPVFRRGPWIGPRLCHAVAQAASSDCPSPVGALPLCAQVRQMAERLVLPASLRHTAT